MTPVFLDTVGLLALWDRSDQWHTSATAAFDRVRRERPPLVSTSLVLFECGNAAARRPYRSAAARLWKELDAAGLLLAPTAQDVNTSWAAYRQDHAGGAGIVDQVSFAVMRRLGLSRAFTNDRHFRAAGFEVLF